MARKNTASVPDADAKPEAMPEINMTPERPSATVGEAEVSNTVSSPEKVTQEEEEEETLLFSGMCPLCWATDVVNPVFLHGSCAKRGSGRDAVLVACQTCANKWLPAFTSGAANGESLFHCPSCEHALTTPEQHQFERLVNGDRIKTMRFCNPITSSDGRPSLFSLAVARERNSGPCGICEEPGATTVCVQCDFALCHGCRVATHSKGKFKEHELIPFDSAQQRQQLKCPVHPSHNLDLFCQTCSECVCVSCCFGGDTHKGHDVAQLPEVAAAVTEELRGVLHGMQETAKDADQVQKQMSSLVESFEKCVSEVELDITSSFTALREALSLREAQLLTKLHDVHRERGAEIQSSIAAGTCLAVQLEASTLSMNKVLAEADAVRLLRLRDTLSRAASAMDASTVALLRRVRGAEEGLASRLDKSDLSSSPIASFFLLSPQHSHDAAVAKYREVLQTMGQLTAASQLPLTAARATAHSVSPPAVTTANEEADVEHAVGKKVVKARLPSHSSASQPPHEVAPPHQGTAAATATPPPPRLTAFDEEPPRAVPLPAPVAALTEAFQLPPFESAARGQAQLSAWGTANSFTARGTSPAEKPSGLSLDLGFGRGSAPRSTRHTEAHTLSAVYRSNAAPSLHAEPSFSFSQGRPVAEASLSTASGWDAGLKLGTKRFAPLDANMDTSLHPLAAKRARRSSSRDEKPLSHSSAPTGGTLQLRL